MKRTLALSSLLLAMALMSTQGVAMQRGGGGGGGGKSGGKSGETKDSTKGQKAVDTSSVELEYLTSKLTLTDPQKAQVKSVLDGRDAQLIALKKEKLPKDESKDKTKALKDAANAKIRTLLTADQQSTFDGTRKKGGKKDRGEAPDTAAAATPAATPGPATP